MSVKSYSYLYYSLIEGQLGVQGWSIFGGGLLDFFCTVTGFLDFFPPPYKVDIRAFCCKVFMCSLIHLFIKNCNNVIYISGINSLIFWVLK